MLATCDKKWLSYHTVYDNEFYAMNSPFWAEIPVWTCIRSISILQDSDTTHTVTEQSTTTTLKGLFLDKVLKNFRDVFDGIGKLTG